MRILRSAQFSAVVLLVAAALGIIAANSPLGSAITTARQAHLPVVGLELTAEHWITDGLLAIFFFLASVELKHELRLGELNSPSKALVPTVAAVGGVVVPALVYLLVVRDEQMQSGWPIPTATDIAFALGVLALVGRHLPTRVRALLLALAVIDDLIAILIIAFFFTAELSLVPLLVAVPVVVAFGLLSRRIHVGNRGILIPVLIALGAAAWVLVYLSGVHATIAGVALGLVFATRNGDAVRHAIEPWSNAVILPLFAFAATLVVLPDVTTTPLGPVFWAILVALPVGKLLGITAGAALAQRLARGDHERIPVGDILTVASLGGIGFTVSLLMNELAFAGAPDYKVDGTLGVLAASVLSMLVGGTVAALRSRWYAARPGR